MRRENTRDSRIVDVMGPEAQTAARARTGSTLPSATLRVSCALAAGLACAVLLPLLGHRSLAMWDEGIYAEIAREMLHGS
ncbi:MAG TPA: hypothetical protein VGM11_14375, partial [Acidobacteriaceae bacterium]